MKKAIGIVSLCCMLFGGIVFAEDSNLLPNRLSAAEEGEWASYRLPGGYVQKLTVTKRDGEGENAQITIKVENIYDGKVVEEKQIVHDAGPAFSSPPMPTKDGVTVAVRNEIARVRGKPVAAGVVEYSTFLGFDDEDNSVTEWWTSTEVPVFGIVKKVTDGEAEWELHQFGFAEKKDAEAKK